MNFYVFIMWFIMVLMALFVVNREYISQRVSCEDILQRVEKLENRHTVFFTGKLA